MWVLSNMRRPAYERLLINVETGAEIALVHMGNIYRIIRYAEPGHVQHEMDAQQIGEYTSQADAEKLFQSFIEQFHAIDAATGNQVSNQKNA